MHYLLLDPDTLSRRLLGTMLPAEAVIHPASTLAEARAVLARVPITVIVLELELPDGCGLELIEELGGRARGVLVVSGTGDVVRTSRACSLGAAFVSKREPAAIIRARV